MLKRLTAVLLGVVMVATVVFAAPASASAEARYEASSRSYVMVVGDYDYFTGSASYTDGITGDNAYTDDSSIARVQGTNSRGRVCIQAVSPGTTVLHITVYNRLIGRTIVSRGVYGRLTSVSSPSDYRADETTYTIKVVRSGDSGSNSNSGSGTRSSSTASSPRNPRSVSLNKSSALIVKGKKTKLVATITPSNARGKIKWKSSNSRVATVSKNGVVTGKRKGKAKITVTVKGKSAKVKATCIVKVVNPPKKVKLNRKSLKLNRGKSFRLKAKVKPKSAYKKLSWSTSNSGVATVSSKGKVKAVGKGSAVITAKAINGKKAKCKVKVGVAVKSVSISSKSVTKYRGDSFRLTAAVNPSDADKRKISWSSSNSKVASVSGGKVSCLKGGTAKITASVANGKSASCSVKVREVPSSVKLDKSTLNLVLGSKYTLNATVLPSDAYNKKITWSSDNTYSVKVSKGGVVTALETGSANITAETYNGKKAVCKVNVVPPTATYADMSDRNVTVGQDSWVYVIQMPYGAVEPIVNAVSSNPDVIRVTGIDNNEIKIKALKKGESVITATLSNGATGQCTVTAVPPKATSVSVENRTVHISLGESVQLGCVQTPKFAEDPVVWESEPMEYDYKDGCDKVLSISRNGYITALGYGRETVKVYIEDNPSRYDIVNVYVDRPKATSISFDKKKVEINCLESDTLSCTQYPADAKDKLTYTSSNPDAVEVNSSGVITAKDAGTAVITAKTSEGVEDTCIVTVVVPDANDIKLEPDNAVMCVGTSATLKYSFDPIGARDKVRFYSSDSSVVSVDANGKITAESVGQAVITAATDSGISDKLAVRVKDEMKSALTTGSDYTGYLDENNNLYMWGYNRSGQLGDGTTTNSNKPVKVLENVKQFSCSQSSNDNLCFTAAVTNDGELYMWGSNKWEQFGDDTKEDSLIPKKIMDGVKAVDVYNENTAVITESGDLKTFGMDFGIHYYKNDNTDLLHNLEKVSISQHHIAVINDKGELIMWGYNDSGQLGADVNDSRTGPRKVMDNVANVEVCDGYTLILTKDKKLYACGENAYGQFGTGSAEKVTLPILIADDVESFAVSGSCAAYVDKKGDLYAAGYYGYGTSMFEPSYSFTKLKEEVRDVCCLYGSLYYIDKFSRVFTQGKNYYGKLGIGTNENSDVFVEVKFY
ncbi:MAG: Ig-like domain-containing protein [Ruminococcus sp.]|nr:Ig-like domain-containing protein [Ruminococcus sp.]